MTQAMGGSLSLRCSNETLASVMSNGFYPTRTHALIEFATTLTRISLLRLNIFRRILSWYHSVENVDLYDKSLLTWAWRCRHGIVHLSISHCLSLMYNDLTRFDIYSFGFDGTEDEKGMLESSRLINQLISAEVELGINSNRIVLGGFSQGGAMSLLAGLTSERKLAGLAILSSWLPLQKKFKNVGVMQQKNYVT